MDMKGCDYVLFGNGNYGRDYVRPGLTQAIERGLVPADFRVVVADREAPAAGDHFSHGTFFRIDLQQLEDFRQLRDELGEHSGRRRVFHLAVAPALFWRIARNLKVSGLAQGDFVVLVEKPVGHDAASCLALQEALSSLLGDGHVVYSDHYLAKPALGGIRRAFEREIVPASVRAIRVATLEERGIAGRGEFYDRTGALRDVMCHLLKVSATVLGEPGPDAVASRIGFVQSLRVVDAVRAQYRRGAHQVGYTDEAHVRKGSRTETYFALALEILRGPWAGVPLRFEAGKASARREGVVRVDFHDAALDHRTFQIHEVGPEDVMDHTRLAVAACRGDLSVWAGADEVLEEWRLVEEALALRSFGELHTYPAGTLRPEAARRLLLG